MDPFGLLSPMASLIWVSHVLLLTPTPWRGGSLVHYCPVIVFFKGLQFIDNIDTVLHVNVITAVLLESLE